MFNKLKEKFKKRKCKTGSCENKNKPVAKSEFRNKNEIKEINNKIKVIYDLYLMNN